MTQRLPPPPVRPLTNGETLYHWLYQLYSTITGETGSIDMDATLAAGGSNVSTALADRAASQAEAAMLMPAHNHGLTAADLQSSQLAAMRGQISALQSQLDAMALMSRPAVLMQQFRAISVSAAYYVKPWEFVDVNATGGAVTVTLPDAASNVGKLCGVAKNDSSANNVTVSGAINGAASATITVQYTALLFISVGTEWRLW